MNPSDKVTNLFLYANEVNERGIFNQGKQALLRLWNQKKAGEKQVRERREAAASNTLTTTSSSASKKKGALEYADFMKTKACNIYQMMASDEFPFKKEALSVVRQINAAEEALKSALNAAEDLSEAAQELVKAAGACISMIKDIVAQTAKAAAEGGLVGAIIGFVVSLGNAIFSGQAAQCLKGIKSACSKIEQVVDDIEKIAKKWAVGMHSGDGADICRTARDVIGPSNFLADLRQAFDDHDIIAAELQAAIKVHQAINQPLTSNMSFVDKVIGLHAKSSGIGETYLQFMISGGEEKTPLYDLLQAGSVAQAGREAYVDAANKRHTVLVANDLSAHMNKQAVLCLFDGVCCSSDGRLKERSQMQINEGREHQLMVRSVELLQKLQMHSTFATLQEHAPLTFRNNRRPKVQEIRDYQMKFTKANAEHHDSKKGPATTEWACHEISRHNEPAKFHELETKGVTSIRLVCDDRSAYREVRTAQHAARVFLHPASGNGNVLIDLEKGSTSTIYRSSEDGEEPPPEPMHFFHPDIRGRIYSIKTSTDDCSSATKPCTEGNQCTDQWASTSICGRYKLSVTPEKEGVTQKQIMANVTHMGICIKSISRRESKTVADKYGLRPWMFHRRGDDLGVTAQTQYRDGAPATCRQTSPCTPNPCKNGGVCRAHHDGSFECACDQRQFEGAKCEHPVDGCASVVCGYGQVCATLSPSLSQCICGPGFKEERSPANSSQRVRRCILEPVNAAVVVPDAATSKVDVMNGVVAFLFFATWVL